MRKQVRADLLILSREQGSLGSHEKVQLSLPVIKIEVRKKTLWEKALNDKLTEETFCRAAVGDY